MDDIADLADNLGRLQHPDGTPFVFPAHDHKNAAQSEEMQAEMRRVNQGIAEAIFHRFDQRGKVLVDKTEAPQHVGGNVVVSLHCRTCAGLLLQTTVDRNTGKGSFSASVLESVNLECPHV